MPYHNDAWPPWTPGTADVPRVYVQAVGHLQTGHLSVVVRIVLNGTTRTVYERRVRLLPAVREAVERFLESGREGLAGRMPVPILLDLLMDAEPGDPGLEEAASLCR